MCAELMAVKNGAAAEGCGMEVPRESKHRTAELCSSPTHGCMHEKELNGGSQRDNDKLMVTAALFRTVKGKSKPSAYQQMTG